MANTVNLSSVDVAIIIPCFNEEMAIAQVITDFKQTLPNARMFVFDNHSTDQTAKIAAAHGAKVIHVPLKGKGNVVRRMFADIEADVYLLVDGDATYCARSAPLLVEQLVKNNLDMVVGCRSVEIEETSAFRRGHRFGNRMLTSVLQRLFGGQFTDALSGYRAFSKRYVKSFPAFAKGFEIEVELTVHALELRMPCSEIVTPYRARPEGSTSKLSTYTDGVRILKTILQLYVNERPLAFFSLASGLFTLLGLLLFLPVLFDYLDTGLVRRFPTAILCTGLMIFALISLSCGLIFSTVTRGRREVKQFRYLSIPPLSG